MAAQATQDGGNMARNLSVAGIQMCVDKGEDHTAVMIKKLKFDLVGTIALLHFLS
jgi:hypothetical protein